jgi:Protein of unknown function (DUF1571)
MRNYSSLLRRALIAAIAIHVPCITVWAESNLSEPVYRTAAEESSTPATAAAATSGPATTQAVAAKPAAESLNFTKQGDEHPLEPVIRGLKFSQKIIDDSIRDYTCTFVKRERVEGELGEQQYILLKVMHQPFSVYMQFLKPYTGREVVYAAGQNEGKLVALDVGAKRFLGKLSLDPNGALAMKGQKHPITSVGIRNLTEKLIKMNEAETKYAECEVMVNPDSGIGTRKATMVQVVHKTPRKEFKNHVSRIFFDNELRIPIHYDAYSWPAKEGGAPPLEESYTYQNLKVNNNYTAREFDPNNNPDIFK